MSNLENLTFPQLFAYLLECLAPGASKTIDENDIDECFDYFLFVANGGENGVRPMTNPENRKLVQESNFLNLVMTRVRDIYEPQIFFEALDILASIEGLEEEICSLGVLKALGTLMAKDLSNAASQSFACKIISKLCVHKNVRNYLGGNQTILQNIFRALNQHSKNPILVYDALTAFVNLTSTSGQNKKKLVSLQLIDLVLNFIQTHKAILKIVTVGMMLLRNLSGVPGLDEIFLFKILYATIGVMQDHAMLEEIQFHGIWILVRVMSGSADNKNLVAEKGGLGEILTAMENHGGSEKVQNVGCLALGIAARLSAQRQAICQSRGVSLLLHALRYHKVVADVQVHAITAIYRLCFCPMVREQPEISDAVTRIIASGKANKSNKKLQKISLLCLIKIANSAKQRQQMISSSVKFISNVRARHPDLEELSTRATQVIVLGNLAAQKKADASSGDKLKKAGSTGANLGAVNSNAAAVGKQAKAGAGGAGEASPKVETKIVTVTSDSTAYLRQENSVLKVNLQEKDEAIKTLQSKLSEFQEKVEKLMTAAAEMEKKQKRISRRRSLNATEVKDLNEAKDGKEPASGTPTPEKSKHRHSISANSLHSSTSSAHHHHKQESAKDEAAGANDVTIDVPADKNLKFKSKRERGSSSAQTPDGKESMRKSSNLTSSTNDTPNRAKRNSKTVGRMEGSKIKGDPVAPEPFVQETRDKKSEKTKIDKREESRSDKKKDKDETKAAKEDKPKEDSKKDEKGAKDAEKGGPKDEATTKDEKPAEEKKSEKRPKEKKEHDSKTADADKTKDTEKTAKEDNNAKPKEDAKKEEKPKDASEKGSSGSEKGDAGKTPERTAKSSRVDDLKASGMKDSKDNVARTSSSSSGVSTPESTRSKKKTESTTPSREKKDTKNVEVDIEKLRQERQRMNAELLAKTKEKKVRPKDEEGAKTLKSSTTSATSKTATTASESTSGPKSPAKDDETDDGREKKTGDKLERVTSSSRMKKSSTKSDSGSSTPRAGIATAESSRVIQRVHKRAANQPTTHTEEHKLRQELQAMQKKFFEKCLEAEEAENKIQTLTLANETLTKDCQKAKNEAAAYERYLELAKQEAAVKAKAEEETRKLMGTGATQSKFFSNREKQKEVSSLKMRISELEKENSKLTLSAYNSSKGGTG